MLCHSVADCCSADRFVLYFCIFVFFVFVFAFFICIFVFVYFCLCIEYMHCIAVLVSAGAARFVCLLAGCNRSSLDHISDEERQ